MKTAGYLEETQPAENKPSAPTAIEVALMSAKLTEEQTAMVADYIAYLRSRQKKGNRNAPK